MQTDFEDFMMLRIPAQMRGTNHQVNIGANGQNISEKGKRQPAWVADDK